MECPKCQKPAQLLCWHCDWVADQRTITKVQAKLWAEQDAREAEKWANCPVTIDAAAA